MEKKRIENKMQDSKREFFHKWDNTTDFEQGHTFNSYKDANKVWEYIATEISREAQIEVLTEIFQTCYQEDSKTLELVEEKLSKLTTK